MRYRFKTKKDISYAPISAHEDRSVISIYYTSIYTSTDHELKKNKRVIEYDSQRKP
jgi:hypothetical protein